MKKIILILIIGNNKLIQQTNRNLLSFLSNNQREEKEISEIANSMYVTMVNDKAKVIATTNPNTTPPQKQPNTTDNYFILFNLNDTNGTNGYTKIEEKVKKIK